jgi:hypothetical protein
MKTLFIVTVIILFITFIAIKAWNAYTQKMKERNIQHQIDEWEELRSEGYYN